MDRLATIEDLLMRIKWSFDQYSDLESIRLTVSHFAGLIEDEVMEMKSEQKNKP